jgi:hypothetical protein
MKEKHPKEPSKKQNLYETLMIMKPKRCPFPLVRVGGNTDGAYLIPEDLKGVTACFSPGVNNSKDFEDDLASSYEISCHMCDYTSDLSAFKTPLIEDLQTFRKKWLDVDGGSESITLEEWITEESPNEADDLLLQMDIEGAEYRNLLACPEETLTRFRIIALELHGLEVANSPSEFEEELGPLLRRLDQFFICVHAHPNNYSGEFILSGTSLTIPRLIELTFLRRDRFLGHHDSDLYLPSLPHPLDITSNERSRPPVFLEGDWLSRAERSVESNVSLLTSKLEHVLFRLENLEIKVKILGSENVSLSNRIEYMEQLFGKLDFPIRIYLRVKEWLKRRKS